MDAQHLDYDDESLVRAALQAAYPAERPIFSQRRGAQIIHAAAVEALQQAERRRPFVGSRIAACVAAALTLLAGTAGVAGAALPGQPLYPIKRAVERAMVAIAGDDTQAALLELRFAERRLDEAAAVADEGDDDLSSAISDRFDAHISAATDLAGDEVADEVEQLEQSRQAAGSGTDSTAPAAQPPTPDPTEAEVPELAVEPVPVPSATPSPSASPLPSPVQAADPMPMADPSPAPSPSPSPSDGPVVPPDLQDPVTDDVPATAD